MGLSRKTTATRDCWTIAVVIRKLLLQGSSSPARQNVPPGNAIVSSQSTIRVAPHAGAPTDFSQRAELQAKARCVRAERIIRLRARVVRPHSLRQGSRTPGE